MIAAPTSGLSADRFHASRPSDLRTARPWHRLSYIIDALPATLRTLVRDLDLAPGDRVLDLGCADRPYDSFFPRGVEVVGADLRGNPHASVELTPDGRVPVSDGSFDAVLSTQVLEHVSDPDVYLAECARVLRPGGRMVLSTHGIMVWHPDPRDLWRWTSEGLRVSIERHQFKIRRFEGVMGLGATGLQLIQDAVYHRVHYRFRPLIALVLQSAIKLVTRFERADELRLNALVFALVAQKS